ncbi:MAG: tetratricopeptide repeat protein [bacterium]
MEDLNELKEKLKRDPHDPHGLIGIGRYYLKHGQYRLAQQQFSQALTLSPRLFPQIILDYENVISSDFTKIGPRLSLAGFHIFQGDLDSAILEFEEALDVNPRDVESYNVLGRIFVKLGRIDDAIALLEKSFQAGVSDLGLSEILAGAYLEKGRLPEAIKLYEDVLTHKPGDKHTLRLLGDMYTKIEDYNVAAKRYEAMFSDDPEVAREVIQRLEGLQKKVEGNVFVRELLADIYMRSLNPGGAVGMLKQILLLEPSKIEEVILKYKELLKNYPDHPQAVMGLADALRRHGSFSESAESYYRLASTQPEHLDAAITGYQEILEFCPEQVLARNFLAEAYLYKKMVKEALQEYEKMLRFDATAAEAVIKKCREISKAQPQLLQARLVMGRAFLAKGETQQAIAEAEEIIAISNKYTPAYLLLGEAHFLLQHCRRALEYLKEALRLEPYNQQIQEQYAQAKRRELDLDMEQIKGRLGKDEWKLSLHLDLAKLYLEKGLHEESIRELQLAQKDQSRAPFACNLLGCIYRSEGRYDLAAAQFNRALELAPSELADFTRSVRFNLGSALEAQGSVNKALTIYESILQENIDFGNLKTRVKYLKETSLNSMRNKNLLAVVAKFDNRNIVALWGREAKVARNGRKENVNVSFGQKYNNSGFEYFIKGMDKAALEEFTLAVQLDANFSAAVNNLAISLMRQGRYHEAKQHFLQAVQLTPNSVVLRNNLGVVNILLGQLDQAREGLEKARELDPTLSAVCLNLGDICYFKGEIEQAIKLYQQVGGFDPLADLAETRLKFKVPS